MEIITIITTEDKTSKYFIKFSQQNSNYQNNNKTKFTKKYYSPYPERIDPITAQAMFMRAEIYILCKYPYLIELNKK